MTADETRARLERVVRDVFDDPTLAVVDDLGPDALKAWDSLGHIRLITAVEESFDVSFTIEEIEGIRSIGQLLALIRGRHPVLS